MKLIGKIIIMLLPLTFPSVAIAQNDFQKIFDEFQKSNEKEFMDFRDRINYEYSEFLRKAWKWFERSEPLQKPEEEPIVPPVVAPQQDEELRDREIRYEEEIVDTVPVLKPEPVVLINETPFPGVKTMTFSQYGTECHVRFDRTCRPSLSGLDESSVADFWEDISVADYTDNLLYDFVNLKQERSLGDWAIYKFSESFTATLYPDNIDAARLFHAYILTQLGFRLRIGYSEEDNHIHLIIATQQDIYGYSYWDIDGQNYYLLDGSDINNLRVVTGDFTSSVPMSLLLKNENILTEDYSESRRLVAKDVYIAEAIVSVNRNDISFYEEYPEVASDFRWTFYAGTPLNSDIRSSLYGQFRPILLGLTERQAAEVILNFVQTAFEYKYDEEVWGKDRPFFAEESMFYPYCDCEDRSILFSHMIRDLLGLDVALVYSPGHLFAAVCFNEDVDGAYIMVNERKFIICEPTCTTGAPVGWSSVADDVSELELAVLQKIEYDQDYKVELYPTPHKALIPFSSGGKYGYKDVDGSIVIPCEYDSVSDYEQGDRALYAAEKDGVYSLFYSDGVGAVSGISGYIPVDIQNVMLGSWCRGDCRAIIKYEDEDEWRFIDTVLGPMPSDFRFGDYDMGEVTYEQNVYSLLRSNGLFSHFIILKRKADNKYGLVNLTSRSTVIPFEYDNMHFIDGDKSQVVVYNESGQSIVNLQCHDNRF